MSIAKQNNQGVKLFFESYSNSFDLIFSQGNERSFIVLKRSSYKVINKKII